MPEQDESEDDRRYQEMIIMDDRPHVDGLTRGTVVEYDGWQWGVVTEIATEKDPTKVGFVLVDELGDWVVRQLEEATGCWEHYEAVRTFRDGEHEYWTSVDYIQEDDMWTVLGPIHPDARDDEKLVTDGGLRGPPGRRGGGSPEWEIEGGEGLPIAHDYRSRLKKDAQIWLFTCCGCGKRMVDPPGPPAGDHMCGGEWICHRFEPKEYSAIRRFNDPRRVDEL